MPARILIVEDEPQFERLILQRFRKMVREQQVEFMFATDGAEALEIIQEHDNAIDMVLTDINMPRMDGLTLISRIRETRPLLKSVIVSAYGDMANIRKAMNLGAFDFVTKPIQFDDLETTIQKTLQETEVIKEAGKARELTQKNAYLQELDRLKTRFFTNISHEFRTPLTVINGMAGQIEENPDRWLKKGPGMIRRNANTMLDLVHQILDLRKLESGKLDLNMVQSDLIPFLSLLFESLQSLAESRDISMHFKPSVSRLILDFDPEKMQRILDNLLGNALKFCVEGDAVTLSVVEKASEVLIVISDTGPGISEAQLPHVFDRFFQADVKATYNEPGTGIGLSLARELARLMGGDITVESEEGRGAAFTIRLPVSRVATFTPDLVKPRAAHPDLQTTEQAQPETEESLETLPALLIVEDNSDVAQYLAACLEGRYHLTFARDGQEGVERAIETIPDIIISDVLMPKKDGYELCRTLKNDARTDHIPIVLLTAKADVASRIEGLEQGADAYLEKPFDKKELLVRLEKLLEIRASLQARYRSMGAAAGQEQAPEFLEDQFVQRMREIIQSSIDNEEFGIHEMCRSIGVSRTQLHRKVKALTGRSTSSFIRYVRLQHARELLAHSDLNIAQVAYESGFKDPKYFSRTFSEEFGEAPKNMRKGQLEQ